MITPNKPLVASVTRADNSFTINSDLGDIVAISSHAFLNNDSVDFAAWMMLPLAMRTGRDLRIQGAGSESTAHNAENISSIWESWLPHHLRSIKVSFSEAATSHSSKNTGRRLHFFSGGIDSTHSLLRTIDEKERTDVITIHGMDYKLDDNDRFTDFLNQTSTFAADVSDMHITVKTNAYQVYDRHKINLPGIHITHIFALAGSGFMFSEKYSELIIAADYRKDQQLISHPWGSNSLTNPLFSNEAMRLITLDDDLRRSEKLSLISKYDSALRSITFCGNYKYRPNNCGTCQKCIRTKMMFLASIGHVPGVFTDNTIPKNWHEAFDTSKNYQRAFLIDILQSAASNNNQRLIPSLDKAWIFARRPSEAKAPNIKDLVKKVLPGVFKSKN